MNLIEVLCLMKDSKIIVCYACSIWLLCPSCLVDLTCWCCCQLGIQTWSGYEMSIPPLWTIYHGAYITLSNTPIMYERCFSSSHYTYVTCNPADVLLMFPEIHWSVAMLLAPDEINSRILIGQHGRHSRWEEIFYFESPICLYNIY